MEHEEGAIADSQDVGVERARIDPSWVLLREEAPRLVQTMRAGKRMAGLEGLPGRVALWARDVPPGAASPRKEVDRPARGHQPRVVRPALVRELTAAGQRIMPDQP